MAQSETVIASMALRHLRYGKLIGDLTTDRTPEARACRDFMATARKTMLEAAPWPRATQIQALTLVTDSEDDDHPTEEWTSSYRYPTNCLQFRKIQSGIRNDANDTKVPMRIARDSAGQLIFTDQDEAIGEWTYDLGVESFTATMDLALSFLLAALIAPSLTGGDPDGLADKAMKSYRLAVSAAAANAFAEEQPDQEPEADSIRARD